MTTTIEATEQRLHVRWGLALSAAVLAVYLVFPNADFSYDSLGYARGISGEFTVGLLHPHHLLIHVAAWGWHHLLSSFVSVDAMRSMQILNSLMGALGILLVYLLAERLIRRRKAATIVALVTAFAYSYWFFSIEFETYVTPTVMALAAAYVILTRAPSVGAILVASLFGSLATLLYQTHLFIIIALGVYLSLIEPRHRRLKTVAFFWAVSAVLVVVPYLFAAHLHGRLTSVTALFHWLTLYSHTMDQLGVVDWTNIPKAIFGIARLFFAAAHNREAVLSGRFGALALSMLVLMAVFALGGAYVLVRSRKDLAERVHRIRPVVVLLGIWIVLYGLFALYFEPYNHEYWFPILVPTTLLAGVIIKWDARNTTVATLAPALLFAVNFVDAIHPDSSLANNEDYVLAQKLHAAGFDPRNDVVLINRSAVDEYYLHFFGERPRIFSMVQGPQRRVDRAALEGTARDLIESTLRSGHRVFIAENELRGSRVGVSVIGGLPGDQARGFYAELRLATAEEFSFVLDGRPLKMFRLIRAAD